MTGYLPHGTRVGDKLRLVPYALNKQDNGSGSLPQALTGTVIYIHPHRRFATVHFPLTGYDSTGHRADKSFRECWHIVPDERRLAHKELEQQEPTGRHNKRRHARPLAETLQERDWTGMSQTQIAAALGASTAGVCSAIRALSKRGVEIKYKHCLNFVQAAQARKAAAGSASSDSGK